MHRPTIQTQQVAHAVAMLAGIGTDRGILQGHNNGQGQASKCPGTIAFQHNQQEML